MDTNLFVDIVHDLQGQTSMNNVADVLITGRLCAWVSTFHPGKLSCHVEPPTRHGSFNVAIKVVFSDAMAWIIRFPRGGQVSDKHADEKVAVEVTALNLIRERTTIPVPKVHAWGIAASNPLGLGPFIMMDFIPGIPLRDLWKDPDDSATRLIRGDVQDGDIETIYRQMARFLLQLFTINFDRIGSLPSPPGPAKVYVPQRPLTWKVHSILQDGGVDTFGNRNHGFATTTEYFEYLIGQDWEQLINQPNSSYGFDHAQDLYLAFKVLKALTPELVNPKFDSSKFKLICDDLGLANLIVRSAEDLTVVGVVDLEWSYVGPAQLFSSAPWWLLKDRPVNPEWDCVSGELPLELTARYFKYLEIFVRVLKEEEARLPEHEEKELSSLIQWSQTSGAMWLHMLLSAGFNNHRVFPFMQLRRHLGSIEWARREADVFDKAELDAFEAQKRREYERFAEAVDKLEEESTLVLGGQITKEDFLLKAMGSPYWPLCYTCPVANNEEMTERAACERNLLYSSRTEEEKPRDVKDCKITKKEIDIAN